MATANSANAATSVSAAVHSSRDFLNALAALGDELRATIELECEGFDPDESASRARAARVQNDYPYFCQTYFPHYVPTAYFSSFHRFVFAAFPQAVDSAKDARMVLMAPRGEAKSTYVTQLGVLWCIVTQRKHMVAILMNSEEQAAEMLAAISAELDTNPRLAMDFAQATGQGRVWQATTIVTRNNIKVRIGGTGKKIRGMRHGPYRPDLVLLDDLENDDNVKQKAQRDKTYKWITAAVTNLGPPGGGMDVFYVGTSLHYDAAINRIAKAPGWTSKVFGAIERWPHNMALWEKWEAMFAPTIVGANGRAVNGVADDFYDTHRAAMDAGAKVSWPEVRPLYRLMCIRATDHGAFDREYQNAPGNDASAPFKDIHFWVDRRNDWMMFGAVDPSMGRVGASGDPSAILVGGLNRATGVLDVVEADIARRVPDLIIERVIDFQAEYGCLAWAVETVQFQAFLYSEIIKRSAARMVPVPAVPLVPHSDKGLRILSLQPHICNGLIRLHRSHSTLLEQLRYWPEADHDDGPDALEMLWKIAQTYGGEWGYQAAGVRRNQQRSTSRSYRAGNDDNNGWGDDDD